MFVVETGRVTVTATRPTHWIPCRQLTKMFPHCWCSRSHCLLLAVRQRARSVAANIQITMSLGEPLFGVLSLIPVIQVQDLRRLRCFISGSIYLRLHFWGVPSPLCVWTISWGISSSVICQTIGLKPLPKRFLHIVRSRASSFNWEYVSDPESYTSGSVATGRASLAGQVKG